MIEYNSYRRMKFLVEQEKVERGGGCLRKLALGRGKALMRAVRWNRSELLPFLAAIER